MSDNKTVYCGSGIKRKDDWITATIDVDKIKDFIETYKSKRFVRLNINIKESKDQFGKDVSISINQYKPQVESTQEPQQMPSAESDDDLLF